MTLALIDERVSEKIERRLSMLGFFPIRVPKSNRLGKDVCSHPDILMFFDGNTLISSCDYAESAPYLFSDIRERCDGVKLCFSDDLQAAEYPLDCIYNAIRFKNLIFCKTDSISPRVLDYLKESGLEAVSTKQGYPRCTVLKLDEENAVTADSGMAKALSSHGINVTLIREGHIVLPCREYGFIGGAAGVFSGTVYFLGELNSHPDSEMIKKAISDLGMKYVSLSDEPLFDGGTIIFI